MTVNDEHSINTNALACAAVEQWLLGEEAQKLILQSYAHSVNKGVKEAPYASVDSDRLAEKGLDVDWEYVYRQRETINEAWFTHVIGY